jgi:hypothetical protein
MQIHTVVICVSTFLPCVLWHCVIMVMCVMAQCINVLWHTVVMCVMAH